MTNKVIKKDTDKKVSLDELLKQDRNVIAKFNKKYYKKVVTLEDGLRDLFASKKMKELIKAKTLCNYSASKNKAGEFKLEFYFSNDLCIDKAKKELDKCLKEALSKVKKTAKC